MSAASTPKTARSAKPAAAAARRRRASETPALATTPLPGKQVTLRRLTLADVPAIFGIFSDAKVMRYWSRPPMTHLTQARTLVREVRAEYRSGDSLRLGIERNRDRTLVGTCTLFHLYAPSRRAEIGYALGSAFWGQGLMHDALQTLVAFAFDELNLNRLEADIDPRNAASARSLTRLGFVREGHLRERWIVAGEVSDTDLYGLLRREWSRAP